MPPAPRGSQSGMTHACPDCDKTFSRKEYMARHHRSKHSKETPFSCEYCARAFSRSDLLRRHYKTCAQAKMQRAGGQPKQESDSPNEPTASSSTHPGDQNRQSFSGERDASQQGGASISPHGVDYDLPVPPPSFGQSSGPAPSGLVGGPSPSASQPSPLYALSPFSVPMNDSTSTLATSNGSNGSPEFPAGQRDLYSTGPSPPMGIPVTAPTPTSTFSASLPSATRPLPPAFEGYAGDRRASIRSTGSETLQHDPVSQSYRTEPSAQPFQQSHQPRYTQNSQHRYDYAPPAPPQQQQQPQPQHQPASSAASTSGLGTSQIHAPAPMQPSSAFKYGTFSQDTLAPGLSGTGSFTKDEVLASEVLRDLMRSPLGPAHGMAPASPMNEVSWHGGKAAGGMAAARARQGRQDQTTVGPNGEVVRASADLVDGQDWTVTGYGAAGVPAMQVSNKLETSPAAQALASYFNQGGVGGITALDLGFATEPSLFPDFLFQPQVVHEEDKRYWMPEQKFCLGYLYPWHVPPIQILSGYARKATEKLLPSMPVIHAASVNLNEMPTHTAFALTVAGGAYETEGQSFSNEMLVEKRVFLVRGFQDGSKTWEDKFASMQSLLLYQLLGLFHRDEQQRLLSHSFHSALIFMLRSLDLPAKVKSMDIAKPRPDLEGEELERTWREWIKVETWRRVNFIIFLADLEYATATKSAQLLSLGDMDLDLPAIDRAWNAQSAPEWLEHMLSPFNPPAHSFHAALRALMSRSEPARDPFSDQAVLLAELSRISSFPLLILSRTLSFLEKKTEEAIERSDSCKNFMNGTGLVDNRDAENRDVLERIRSGRQYLQRLPGGLARGGGERWFTEIIPSAEGYTCSKSCSPAPTPSYRSTPATATSATSGTASHAPGSHHGGSSAAGSAGQSLEEMFAEFEPQPYKPYYGPGGTRGNETYEEAQARMSRLTERKLDDVRQQWPQFLQ